MDMHKVFIVLVLTLMFALLTETTASEPKTQQTSKTDSPQKAGRDGAPMVLIPAGEFQMGSSDGDGDESPVHTVYLDAFYIDMYEVTNQQYARFLNQYGRNSNGSGKGLVRIGDGCCRMEKMGNIYRPKSGYEDHPVVYVSWYGAVEYAHFYGKRLPTAAEWEKAARGGLVGKRYPWGNSISHDHANYHGNSSKDEWKGTSPVGSFPPNGYGLYDMAGNVGEWCEDWYDKDYYSASPRANPAGPSSGYYRVLRGGSWLCNKNGLRIANRGICPPTSTSSCHWGFRCVFQDWE
jgi:formylglycine-generating enzyme required for sulfatase activity